jgi:23S rRNA (cytosine1962-C5)-methyltransferase
MTAQIFLKQGREKSVLKRHPWIFSGSILRVNGSVEAGETVSVHAHDGNFLAWGAYSPFSQIRIRIWSWKEAETIDDQFIFSRLSDCWQRRIEMNSLFHMNGDNAFRLVNGESDGLPGLIVDCYANILVLQILSAGIEYWRNCIVDCLASISGLSHIIERSDVDIRRLENLPQVSRPLRGDAVQGDIRVQENGMSFWVDIQKGHKTGFYLDQKENRRLIKAISQGKNVLDCFCYSGGFTCSAAEGGARSIIAVDTSEEALILARKNLAENNLSNKKIELINADVFTQLRKYRDRGQSFDCIILDPPKFAQSASMVVRAARGYKDINLLAFKLLNPGGMLATFSCSGGVSEDLFQKIVAGAAFDAGVEARIIKRLFQSFDHPVSLNFPEGAYLKGFLLLVNP